MCCLLNFNITTVGICVMSMTLKLWKCEEEKKSPEVFSFKRNLQDQNQKSAWNKEFSFQTLAQQNM